MGSSYPHLFTPKMALTRHEIEKSFISSPSFGGNINKVYYQHGVKYGDYFDLRTYHNVKTTFKNKRVAGYEKATEGNKRIDSVARAKVKLFRLTVANVGKHGRYRPIFATYTFAQSITEYDKAVKTYTAYLRRLQAHIGYHLRYVAVPQIQWKRFEKTGQKVWHFHIVFFNIPKLDIEKNDKMWGQGFVKLEFPRGVRNVGAYIAGYMTKKDFEEIPINKRFYYCSRGLLQPQDFFNKDSVDGVLRHARLKTLSIYEGTNFSQTKYKLL